MKLSHMYRTALIVATWFRRRLDFAQPLSHFPFFVRVVYSHKSVKPPAGSSRQRPFLPLLEPRPLH